MAELYFSTNLTSDTTLCISTLTDSRMRQSAQKSTPHWVTTYTRFPRILIQIRFL